MIEEYFSKGESLVHDIDPRIRIICAIIYSFIIAVTGKFEVALGGLAAGLVLVMLARLSAKHLLRRLLIVNSFPAETLVKIGPLNMTEQGILYAFMLTIKCNAIVLVNIGLLSTCGMFNLVHALNHLRVPNKIVHLLFFIYRYAYVMQYEYLRIKDTLRIRGFKPRTSIFTYRTYGSIVGTLLVRGYERSEQVHKAMVCRGFKGHYWLLDHFSLKRSDVLAATIMTLGAALLLVLQWKIV
jgi:cobalt/nickel transport system permease protein